MQQVFNEVRCLYFVCQHIALTSRSQRTTLITGQKARCMYLVKSTQNHYNLACLVQEKESKAARSRWIVGWYDLHLQAYILAAGTRNLKNNAHSATSARSLSSLCFRWWHNWQFRQEADFFHTYHYYHTCGLSFLRTSFQRNTAWLHVYLPPRSCTGTWLFYTCLPALL